MKKRKTQYLKILLSCMLVVSISGGIILGTQLLYKINHKTKEDIMAEKNKVVLGDESIFYVDLTKKPDDYEKISKVENDENEKSLQLENTVQNESSNETIKQEKKEIQNVVNQINQNYYDVNVDMETGTITADGEEANIKELLSDDKQKEELYNYLKDNVIGDVQYKDGKIKIENPYSTKTIMMQTEKLTELEDCGNVESIVRVSEDVYCVHYKDAKSTKDGYNLLKNNELVENVAKDAKVSALENPVEDIKINTQEAEIGVKEVSGTNYAWGYSSTGISQYVNKLNYAKNSNEIKVAVLDTGVRTTHEVFKNKTTGDRLDLTDAYNYVNNNSNIADDNGHGTMVAGIISESTSNNVKIVPVKVLGSDGKGDYSVAIQAASAIVDKVDILNVSLGIDEAELPASTKAMGERMLKPVYESGKVIVCAAGNDGKESVCYPASSQYTIAVSAIDYNSQITSFSNYGSTIDFSAPGQGLVLPYYTGDNLYNTNLDESSAEYAKNSGTSFASPYIAADFAMIKSENPKSSIESMKNILIENCEDLGDSGKDKYYGYGNVNFDTKMFSKPVIASVEVSTNEQNEKEIDVYAVGGNKITSWAYTLNDNEPNSEEQWYTFSTSSKAVQVRLTTSVIQKYYIWIKDEKNNVVKQEVDLGGGQDNANTTNNTTTDTNITNNTTTNTTNNTTPDTNITDNTTTNTTNNTTPDTNITNNTTTNTTNNTTPDTNTTNNTTTNTTNNTTPDVNTTNNTTPDTNTTNNTTTDTNITNNTITNDITNTNVVEIVNNISNNTNNNNTIGGKINTVNGSNTIKDSVNITQNNSKISNILPKTGKDRIAVLAFVIIVITGTFTFIKYNKMKDVK